MLRRLERQAYRLLRATWRVSGRVPFVQPLAIRVLRKTGFDARISKVLYSPAKSSSSTLPAVMESALAGVTVYNSSTYGLTRPYPKPPAEFFQQIEQAYLAQRRTRTNTRVAVLTALAGGYEQLQRHEHLMADAEYLVVTDSAVNAARPVQVVSADYFDIDPTRRARFVKTHPYLYAGDVEIVVWIDSNIVIRGDLTPIIDRFVASGHAVGAVQHPLRQDLSAEGRECIKRKKDEPQLIEAQLARYASLGYSTEQLIEANLLFFRMDHPGISKFFAHWWSEIEGGSRRDQLSLNYAADKAGITFHWITEWPNSVRNHPDLALIHHVANQPERVAAVVRPRTASRFADVRSRINASRGVSVDIVVCVHNAYQVTKDCLASVKAHRNENVHRVVLVDDGSGPETAALLRAFAAHELNTVLIRNDVALGYTKAVNLGVAQTNAEFVILLNSDTVVSADFAEKLIDAARSRPGVGIVGPLSNAASSQSIPEHRSGAQQTAVNALPTGMSAQDMDLWCEQNSPSEFPRTQLVHGFCFGLTRGAISAVGRFDEENFPVGYGEENDYCFRATQAGVGLLVATNTYVFHAKSKSYSEDRRAEIGAVSNQRLRELYGTERIRRSILSMQGNPALVAMRAKAAMLYADKGLGRSPTG